MTTLKGKETLSYCEVSNTKVRKKDYGKTDCGKLITQTLILTLTHNDLPNNYNGGGSNPDLNTINTNPQ